MKKEDIQASFATVAKARREWAGVQTAFNTSLDNVMRRLLHEAAAASMSVEDVAKMSGFTPKRVRLFMKKFGLDYRSGRALLAKSAAQALERNTELLGEAPAMDSMLAYLPMGEHMENQISIDRSNRKPDVPYDKVAGLLREAYQEAWSDRDSGLYQADETAQSLLAEANL